MYAGIWSLHNTNIQYAKSFEKGVVMVSLIIDGENITVDGDTTIIAAAQKVNVNIPRLCYLKV